MPDVDRVVQSLLASRNLGPCVTHHRVLEAHPARLAPFPAAIHPELAEVLRRRGIGDLYSHQSEAAACALEGGEFVAVTPTASGKTLCYNLPC